MPCCLTAPSLARINVFIRKVLDIHPRTIYGDVSWPSVTEIRLKFAHINLQWISGVNEIKIAPCTRFSCFPFLFQCFAWWNVFQELPSFTMETHLVCSMWLIFSYTVELHDLSNDTCKIIPKVKKKNFHCFPCLFLQNDNVYSTCLERPSALRDQYLCEGWLSWVGNSSTWYFLVIILQGSTLRHACMSWSCSFCPRAYKLLWLVMCLTGQVIFQFGHVLIFPAVYISFAGQSLARHVKVFAGHIFS